MKVCWQRLIRNIYIFRDRFPKDILWMCSTERGFEEIVRKQEILYEQRKVLSEEQKCGLDRKLQMISVGMQIQATYFKENREMKPAGQYHTICGTVEFFDPSIHLRIDDTIILIPDLCELSGDIFEELELPC